MTPTPYSPVAIAREALRQDVEQFVHEKNQRLMGLPISDSPLTHYEQEEADAIIATVTPIILAAAARVVRESGAVEALESSISAGDIIAAHFDPGPIPANEPTQADHDFGNWEYVRTKARAALANLKRLT